MQSGFYDYFKLTDEWNNNQFHNELLDLFRMEKYISDEASDSSSSIAKKIYYLFRPLLPVNVRKHLQKARLNGWNSIDFPKWPVDVTVERLMADALSIALKSNPCIEIPFIWFWPKGYKSCCIITHDVETQQGRDFCNKLMDIDETYGFKSGFQIIPEERYEVTNSFLNSIKSRSFEINIHDLRHDSKLYNSKEEFPNKANKINEYCKNFAAKGFRSGVLYRNLDWYNQFDFEYDMSVPNVGHLDPQRGGCCTVMPYFIGNILELPLTTVQDYSLFHIMNDYSIDLWKNQMAIIKKYSGLISFNVHPDYIMNTKAEKCYRSLLEYLKNDTEKDAVWNALPGEVNNWWRKRHNMHLIYDDASKFSIIGDENRDAVIAYAFLENDKLKYRF